MPGESQEKKCFGKTPYKLEKKRKTARGRSRGVKNDIIQKLPLGALTKNLPTRSPRRTLKGSRGLAGGLGDGTLLKAGRNSFG